MSGQTQPLPARRPTARAKIKLRVVDRDIRFLLDVGFHPDTKMPLEVFLVSSTGRDGSMLKLTADDIGVAISHMLQAGYTLEDCEKAFAIGGLAHKVARAARLFVDDPDGAEFKALEVR